MLDPNRFVIERQERWQELEAELDQIAQGRFESMTLGRARRLGELYRLASGDLIRARTESANAPLIDYLNGLVGRAYGAIYRGRRTRWFWAVGFLAWRFPMLVRRHSRQIAAAAGIMLLGFFFGLIADTLDSSAKYSLLSPEFAAIEDRMDEMKTAAAGGRSMSAANSTVFSVYLMQNNITVSFLALALGATAGLGTTYVLFQNGVMVGALGAIFMRHGLSLYFWANILAHGVTELTAIFIAGGAGFVIAGAIVSPGDHGLRRALQRRGAEAVEIALGCVFLLVIAGLLEAFVTPQGAIPHGIKLAIGAGTGLALVAYLGFNEPLLKLAGLGATRPLGMPEPPG